MNKYIFSVMTLMTLGAQSVLAVAETTTPDLQESLKTQSSEPNLMSIIFALFFVIFLIYITGIIYSKLNIVGAKAVKEQLRNAELNRAMVISTTQLGQGKNLHVIELNEKRYLIGATLNSINLIKELEIVNEKPAEKVKENDEEEIDNAIKVLYGDSNDEIIEEERKEEFNVHKKYL